jgi:hypothetical protein
MFKNGEMEQVIKMFENPNLQKNLPYHGGVLSDKTPRNDWKRGYYYNNANLNDLFIAYLAGYSAGKCRFRHSPPACSPEEKEADRYFDNRPVKTRKLLSCGYDEAGNKVITDGEGGWWAAICNCGSKMKIVRPGKAECVGGCGRN